MSSSKKEKFKQSQIIKNPQNNQNKFLDYQKNYDESHVNFSNSDPIQSDSSESLQVQLYQSASCPKSIQQFCDREDSTYKLRFNNEQLNPSHSQSQQSLALSQENIQKQINPVKNHPKLFGRCILQYHQKKFPHYQISEIPQKKEDIDELINQPNVRDSAVEYFESNQIFFDIINSKVDNLSQVIQSFQTYYQAFKNNKPLDMKSFQ